MIKSMTGYGRAREVRNKRDITVEVRSVNNRYLDCTVKMPRMYSFAEDAVKQYIRGIFTVQSRYRLLTERTSTVISRLFRTSLARP